MPEKNDNQETRLAQAERDIQTIDKHFATKADLQTEISLLRAEMRDLIHATEVRLVRWIVGMAFASLLGSPALLGGLLALVKTLGWLP